jgi:hypothetical protein
MRFDKLLLVTLVVISALIIAEGKGERPGADQCGTLPLALEKIEQIKQGDSRSKVEHDFQEDGGLNQRERTRYSFKRCRFIKIDVDFAFPKNSDLGNFAPTDKILHVSRPYLEYPIQD